MIRPGVRFGLPLGALTLLGAACGDGRWDWERMRVQRRADAYGASPAFASGAVMQAPPAGTVPRERVDDEHAAAASVSVTAALLAEGRARFGIYCAPCHGAAADGNSVVASNMREHAPPSLLSPVVRALPPETVYRVVRDGFGRMPSYAADLSVAQRWAVVAYVRALQARSPLPDGGGTR